jgi:hypothetical protein
MLSSRRAARIAAAVPPVAASVEPSGDWRDYVDEEEQPPPYWPADEVWLWRHVRAWRRVLEARRAWLAENGREGRADGV